ncbi:Frataxin [Ganoderma leucocontextum]|nr:Frataxin [Ganoderma leucocontextum]
MLVALRQAYPTAARSLSAFGRVSCPGAVRTLHVLSQHHRTPVTSPSPCIRRHYTRPAPQVEESNLPVNVYHQYSDATMEKMLESLENLLDELGESEYEVDYGSGVLTLKLGTHGTYVINKQPPNKQIWLSSPFSGPKRYDYTPEQDGWVYSRDGRSLSELLNQELGEVFGRKVDLGLADVTTYVN